MWPTLQLGIKIDDENIQRYGDTFAGVYERYDNRVHHKFPAFGVKPRTALPSEEEVFNELLSEGVILTYDMVMADQNQELDQKSAVTVLEDSHS